MTKFFKGDQVERIGGSHPGARGRVTGGAPNGWVRVMVGKNNHKIWKPDYVSRLPADLLSDDELCEEFNRLGLEDCREEWLVDRLEVLVLEMEKRGIAPSQLLGADGQCASE